METQRSNAQNKRIANIIFGVYTEYHASYKDRINENKDNQDIFFMLREKENKIIRKTFMPLQKKLRIYNFDYILYTHYKFPRIVIYEGKDYYKELYIIELRGFNFYIIKKPDKPDKRVMKILDFYLGIDNNDEENRK